MKQVAVIYGGKSAEREVSLNSGKAVDAALNALEYKTHLIDAKDDLASSLKAAKPDIVFNALHGRFGEDGCVQGLLELLEIPYTHSGVLASALAMDKPMAKRIFTAAGLLCPPGMMVAREAILKGDPLPRPYVVKPANEGSSVGVKLVFPNDNFFFTEENWIGGESALVETYIPGREVTVAVLEGKALGVTEIKPSHGFYDYDNKYTDGGALHLCPAPLNDKQTQEVMEMAVTAHHALGCRGLSRADFRFDDSVPGQEKFYILELNTQPGMTNLSLSPEIAAYAGISFNELVRLLVESARLGA